MSAPKPGRTNGSFSKSEVLQFLSPGRLVAHNLTQMLSNAVHEAGYGHSVECKTAESVDKLRGDSMLHHTACTVVRCHLGNKIAAYTGVYTEARS